MPNAVIYARYSSHNQQETSIEGQLKECYSYCEQHGFTVIHEYIDRALSGTNDQRPEFRQMIKDSASKSFEYVVVYQLDRFARNRNDSAINKIELKKHGVRLVSAKEHVADDPSGILMESVLEGLAEYYSAELSQKVRRGMDINAQKCLSTGGNVALGFKVNSEKQFEVDEQAAPIVREIFERYAKGDAIHTIYKSLNERGYKTSRGVPFNKSTLTRLLQNKRYIGVYTYKGTEIPDGLPRVISDSLFEQVQRKLADNKRTHTRAKPECEFLLTTKLFCGSCKEMMRGTGGTSKTGRQHYYYGCKNVINRKGCKKKNVPKDMIENAVIEVCRQLLSPDTIKKIAKAVIEQNKRDDKDSKLTFLESQLAKVERKQKNLMDAILECDSKAVRQQLYLEVPKLEEEKEQYTLAIAQERVHNIPITQKQIEFFLSELANGDIDNITTRKALIAVLINKIYLYDDDDNTNVRMVIVFNAGEASPELSVDLLNQFDNMEQKSSTDDSVAPPTESELNPIYIKNGFYVVIWL